MLQVPVLPRWPPLVLLLRPWGSACFPACADGLATPLGAWLADAVCRARLPSRGRIAVEGGLQASACWRLGFARLGMALTVLPAAAGIAQQPIVAGCTFLRGSCPLRQLLLVLIPAAVRTSFT